MLYIHNHSRYLRIFISFLIVIVHQNNLLCINYFKKMLHKNIFIVKFKKNFKFYWR